MNTNISENNKSYWRIYITACILSLFNLSIESSFADKGGWYVSTEPVILTESGQKAIIGWDGETEVLCLATDVSSSRQTIIIEFLPLPLEPKVTLGGRETFDVVQKVLARRGVEFIKPGKGWDGRGLKSGTEGEPFTITFHERLGAHDVTVLKVNQADEFAEWIEEKAKALAGTNISVPDSLRKLIAKYLNEYHCPYFVFDVIEVGPDPKSVEPIIYEFKSGLLFYPLEISSTFHGKTSIDLIVFSEDLINPDPLLKLNFLASNTSFVDANDMQEVLPQLRELLGSHAMVQAFRYSGDISHLKGNIAAGWRRDNLAYTSGEMERAKSISFYLGVTAASYGGVLIAFASLWPMYFAAKRQRPRWWLRLLAGFLLGMPLGLGLILAVVNVLRGLLAWTYDYHYFPSGSMVLLIVLSMSIGFIIFCFQLGLRKRWYLWGLVYACLSIPATFISNPDKLEHIFDFEIWSRLWKELQADPVFILCLLVFIILFLIAKLIVWPMYFAAKRQKPRWFLRLLAGFLLGMPLGFGLIFAIAYMLENLLKWKLFLYRHDPVILSVCSMGIGFIIFCFQLGLRKRWYLWGLVYACLSIPATFISNRDNLEYIFDFDIWGRLWKELQAEPSFILYLLVFGSLFLIARFTVWITDLWQRNQVSRCQIKG